MVHWNSHSMGPERTRRWRQWLQRHTKKKRLIVHIKPLNKSVNFFLSIFSFGRKRINDSNSSLVHCIFGSAELFLFDSVIHRHCYWKNKVMKLLWRLATNERTTTKWKKQINVIRLNIRRLFLFSFFSCQMKKMEKFFVQTMAILCKFIFMLAFRWDTRQKELLIDNFRHRRLYALRWDEDNFLYPRRRKRSKVFDAEVKIENHFFFLWHFSLWIWNKVMNSVNLKYIPAVTRFFAKQFHLLVYFGLTLFFVCHPQNFNCKYYDNENRFNWSQVLFVCRLWQEILPLWTHVSVHERTHRRRKWNWQQRHRNECFKFVPSNGIIFIKNSKNVGKIIFNS